MSDDQQKHFNRVSYKRASSVEPVIIANVSQYTSFQYSGGGYWQNEMTYFTTDKIERLSPNGDEMTTAQINFHDGTQYKMYLNMPFDKACQLIQDIRTGRHGNRPVDLREQTIFHENPALREDSEEHYKAYRDKAQKWAFK